MKYLLLSVILLYIIIGRAYGRIVNFSLLTFGQNVSVTFNGKTVNMKAVDDFSRVYSGYGICPDDEFEYVLLLLSLLLLLLRFCYNIYSFFFFFFIHYYFFISYLFIIFYYKDIYILLMVKQKVLREYFQKDYLLHTLNSLEEKKP